MAGGEEEGRGRGESVCVNGHFEPLVRERIVSMGRVAIDKENLSLISDGQMGCLGLFAYLFQSRSMYLGWPFESIALVRSGCLCKENKRLSTGFITFCLD